MSYRPQQEKQEPKKLFERVEEFACERVTRIILTDYMDADEAALNKVLALAKKYLNRYCEENSDKVYAMRNTWDQRSSTVPGDERALENFEKGLAKDFPLDEIATMVKDELRQGNRLRISWQENSDPTA